MRDSLLTSWPRCFLALALAAVSASVSALDLKPGRNANLPAGTYTWDCYLPKAYFDNPQATFPVFYLSSPEGFPVGFNNYGIDPWAERNGIVVIGINDSSNKASDETCRGAQKAVMAAGDAALRLHPALRYAMGTSGGGARSVGLVGTAPERFAGVFVNVHSAGPPAKHIACVYVGGEADTVHAISAVRSAYESAKSNGNQVRFVADPGDHDAAPRYGDNAVPYWDWLLFSTCISHPKLTPADITLGIARIDAELTAIAAAGDAAARLTRCESLLDIPALVADKRVGATLLKIWSDSAMAASQGKDPVQAHRLLTLVTEHPQFAKVAAKDGKALLATLKDLRKAEPAKSEWSALQAYRSLTQAEKKAGATKGALRDVASGYMALAKKFPGTESGQAAEAAARRLAAKLAAKP